MIKVTVEHQSFGLISIIMAAYNAEKTIVHAIESVLNQTYPHFELLVVNDCSTDRTVELVKEIATQDKRVRLISNQKNSGVSYTRKHGLDEARGSWIAILDSDDAWAPEKLEKQIALQEKTNADLLFTGSAFMDASGQPIDWYLHVPSEVTYHQLLKQNILPAFLSEGSKMEQMTIPTYETCWNSVGVDGRKMIGVDFEANAQILKEFFYGVSDNNSVQ